MRSGVTVQQERTMERVNKWKQIKALNDGLSPENKLTIVGVDIILEYKYSVLQLLELIGDRGQDQEAVKKLCIAYENQTMDFSSFYDSEGKRKVKEFVTVVDSRPEVYEKLVSDKRTFNHIISNIKITLEDFSKKREDTIFNNYQDIGNIFAFYTKPQFMRIGFAHLEKAREGKGASFFTQLIEKEVHKREEVFLSLVI